MTIRPGSLLCPKTNKANRLNQISRSISNNLAGLFWLVAIFQLSLWLESLIETILGFKRCFKEYNHEEILS